MDPASDISALLDSLTSQTSAERFGQVLAEPSFFPASAALPISPTFDVPLVCPQQPSHDPLTADLLASPAFALPTLVPGIADYSLPLSAVTGASSRSDSNSHHSPRLPIRKKRARPTKIKMDKFLSLHPRPTTSDVSSAAPSSALLAPATPPSKPEPILASPKPTPTQPHHAAQPSPSINPACVQSPQPKSHTRKCREKVTKQFENLLEVLPRPPNGVEVKHKAQILELAITTFRHLLLKRTSLQAEIALASNQALRQWMDVTIASVSASLPRDLRGNVPLSAILEPFVGLYCVKKGWTYGEMWIVNDNSHASLASCVFNTDDEEVLKSYGTFATMSKSRYAASARLKAGIVQRVVASKRPEWLDDLAADQASFERAPLAAAHGLRVAHAVPVMLGEHRCAGVLLFAEVTPCAFSTADMATLQDYTSFLGALHMEYASQAEKRIYQPRPQEAKLEAKPIRIAEAAITSPDRTSTSYPPAQYPGCSVEHRSGASGSGFLPQSSETSALFSEPEFLSRA